MATTSVQVTAMFKSERDAKWYMIVLHGDMIEHVRLHEPTDAPGILVRSYGLKLPAAKKLLAKLVPSERYGEWSLVLPPAKADA